MSELPSLAEFKKVADEIIKTLTAIVKAMIQEGEIRFDPVESVTEFYQMVAITKVNILDSNLPDVQKSDLLTEIQTIIDSVDSAMAVYELSGYGQESEDDDELEVCNISADDKIVNNIVSFSNK